MVFPVALFQIGTRCLFAYFVAKGLFCEVLPITHRSTAQTKVVSRGIEAFLRCFDMNMPTK